MLSPSPLACFVWLNPNRLFFIEGALTIFVALVAAFVLPDFPSTSHRWLSPTEVRLALRRMEEDAGVGDEYRVEVRDQGRALVGTLIDWKVVYMALKYVVPRFQRAPNSSFT